MLKGSLILSEEHCFHCGEDIISQEYIQNNKKFCCSGCKTIYEILTENNLSNYYLYNKVPGKTQSKLTSNFDYLDVKQITRKLIDFEDDSKNDYNIIYSCHPL
ncbi:heavy metal translocating P-type ATPase metal-binding domain-containing protein [Pedobacter steynii]